MYIFSCYLNPLIYFLYRPLQCFGTNLQNRSPIRSTICKRCLVLVIGSQRTTLIAFMTTCAMYPIVLLYVVLNSIPFSIFKYQHFLLIQLHQLSNIQQFVQKYNISYCIKYISNTSTTTQCNLIVALQRVSLKGLQVNDFILLYVGTWKFGIYI